MTSSRPDRLRVPPRGKRVLAPAPWLSVVALLTAIDIWAQPSTALVGIVIVAPLPAALLGTTRDVIVVGSAALAIVALSPIWRHNFGDGVHVYRAVASILAGLIARAACSSGAIVSASRCWRPSRRSLTAPARSRTPSRSATTSSRPRSPTPRCSPSSA